MNEDRHNEHPYLDVTFDPLCSLCQDDLSRAFTRMADKPGLPRNYPEAVLETLREVRAESHERVVRRIA